MEIISSQPFSMASFSVNDSQLPAGIVISSAAKRSGEISPRNVASPWWQEISRPCVSIKSKVLNTHTGPFLRSR